MPVLINLITDIQFTFMDDKEKQQMPRIEKLEPANV